jgi:hypothetical protein
MFDNEQWDKFAAYQAKGACFSFIATCLFVAFFKPWGFGLYWFGVVPVGLFAASLAVAPFAAAQWYFGLQGNLLLGRLLGWLHSIGIFPVSYFGLKAVSNWIAS